MADPLVFKVHRQLPELIIPAKPTPYGFKPLSDIDDQDGLRVQLPIIFFYRFHPSMRIHDPVRVLKQALAQTLVFYYPFAGRIREWRNRKLVVECTGEGVLFIEAAADVSFELFGDAIRPPFPCFDELLFDVPGSNEILDCPLMLIQEEISSLRRLAPPHLGHCSRYELITSCMWRCRTIALQPNPEEEMRIICIVNARNAFNPPIPEGYYGNCLAYSAVKAKAGDLSQKPIGYAVELIRKAKAKITEEYMRSVADLMVIKDRPWYTMARSFLVSGTAQLRFDEVDFGWGRAVFGGPARCNVASFHIAFINKKGEDGILVTLCLRKPAMQRFLQELDSVLKDPPTGGGSTKLTLPSAL